MSRWREYVGLYRTASGHAAIGALLALPVAAFLRPWTHGAALVGAFALTGAIGGFRYEWQNRAHERTVRVEVARRMVQMERTRVAEGRSREALERERRTLPECEADECRAPQLLDGLCVMHYQGRPR